MDTSVSRDSEASATRRVLAIGELNPGTLPDIDDLALIFARFDELDALCLAQWRPALVISPLVGQGFDCFDIAERLAAAGFSGRYLAVVDTLPAPSVVRREIAAQFPNLDFDVLILG